MPSPVRIDMVSDATCPWCAIALFNLLHALRSLEGEIQAKLHLQPLELHPSVKAGGEVRAPYLQQHQRPARVARQPCWADIRLHGLAVQLDMGQEEPRMLYNTLDAHRLLQWADNQGHNYQIALAQQLVHGYFGLGANIADHQVLADAAETTAIVLVLVRKVVDFAGVHRFGGYAPGEAVFKVVRREADGWLHVVAADSGGSVDRGNP